MTYNDKQKQFQFNDDMSASTYIRGANIQSFCEIPGNLILVPLPDKLLVVFKWQVLQHIEVACDYTLSRHLTLPGFDIEDYPFIINFNQGRFELVNVRTGHRDVLIVGTAGNLYEQ